MTIEEVSVLFDTGRRGNAQAAAALFNHGKVIENDEDGEKGNSTELVDDVEKVAQPKVVVRGE